MALRDTRAFAALASAVSTSQVSIRDLDVCSVGERLGVRGVVGELLAVADPRTVGYPINSNNFAKK